MKYAIYLLGLLTFAALAETSEAQTPAEYPLAEYHLDFHVQAKDLTYVENLDGGVFATYAACVQTGRKTSNTLMSSGDYDSVDYTCFFKGMQ